MTATESSPSSPVAASHLVAAARRAEASESAPNPLFRLGMKTIIQLVRYWWVLGGAMFVSLTAAVVLSSMVSETVWTLESILVYMKLPIADSAERLYIPPDLRTLSSLVKAPTVLREAIKQSDTDISPRTLSMMLSVEEPRGTQKLTLKIGHPDPDLANSLLACTSKAFQDHVADMRRAQIKRNIEDIDHSIERNNNRMLEVNARLRQFAAASNVDDVENEILNLTSSVASAEYQYNTQKVEQQALTVQRNAVQQQLDDQKREEELNLASEKEAEAAEESLADNRRRQDRLNELISEERRLNEIRAKLGAKQAEFDRKIVLFEKGYLSRNDFEAVQAEVDALKSQIMEGKRIDEWKAELDRIDKMVVPKSKTRRVGSPIIHQTMFKLVELDLHILASKESQRQLAISMAESRKRLSELKGYKVEHAGLLAEMQSVSDERDSLNNQRSALMAVHDIGPYEFSIAQAPTTDMFPPASSRKKMFVVIFAGVAGLLTAPILLLAVLTGSRKTLLEYAEDQQLPFLTRKPGPSDVLMERAEELVELETAQWSRTVALRIQQMIPHAGSVVSMVPAKRYQYRTDIGLLRKIAEVLARRDERVLILEFPRTDSVALYLEEKHKVASTANHECQWRANGLRHVTAMGHGVFDFANDSHLHLSDIVQPLAENIDLITGGSCDPERLFSERISALLNAARQKYSIVLTYGICLHETTNVEMLARHSEGLIVLNDRADLMTQEINETLQNLKLLNAPLFGLAVRVTAERRPRIRFLFRHRRQTVGLAVQRAAVPGPQLPNPQGT